MIKEEEIYDIKNQDDDMIRNGKLHNVDELVTPGQESGRTEQSPDKFVDGESIEDLEESPERVI